MKRLVLATVFLSSLACSPADEPRRASKPAAHSTQGAKPVDVAPVLFEVPDDPLSGVMPVGFFTDVASLCVAQKTLVLPHLFEVVQSRGEDPIIGYDVEPECDESPEVLADARIALGGEFLDVKAIRTETGRSTDTFLVVQTSDGWTAIREAFLSEEHDDPGCPSIERENSIDEVRVESSSLVVLTTAGRNYIGEDTEGALHLSQARACHLGEWGPTCSPRQTIAAKYLTQDGKDSEAPPIARDVFTTTFEIDAAGVLRPALPFENSF